MFKTIVINDKDKKNISILRIYIKVHLKDAYLVTYKSLTKMNDLLPKSDFIQVHKSFIINKKKLDYIAGNLAVVNTNKIPLGQKFKSNFLNKIKG